MDIKNVVVIGTGTMGQGIAQWFLQQKVAVEMVDSNYEFALKGHAKIFENLEGLTYLISFITGLVAVCPSTRFLFHS